ncbi:Meiotically up-regulated gene 65 protein [Cytospora mali]|uniref:Meiotically up-regulated gene 65 protein n=1 Tax=Cytospora mali TaxID=578113 RepID=A0A194V3C0_CYTMA|nr:Meiotically up-regulated gene 65 protein [Valsa mali var. pyri (nom. inval.)]
MRKHSTVRRSRRALPLKDSDYDHEIALVDHAAETPTPQAVTPQQTDTTSLAESEPESRPQPEAEQRPSSSSLRAPSGTHSPRRSTTSSSTESRKSSKSSRKSRSRGSSPGEAGIPTVHVNEPTPVEGPRLPASTPNGNPGRRNTPESAIDVLYENERGGILCGLPLFSPKALGQLDPPNWTNASHKPSPTSIKTAQVPDPSWTWAWPEWHINQDVGVDENGWEYSFMFAKLFSWHPARWYNSCVRRRAWTRKRVKRDPEAESNDPHMLNAEYFTVRPSMETNRSGSRASSRHSKASRTRMSVSSWVSAKSGEKPDIEDIETLMAILRRSRIDREKLEAVDDFLEHGEEELIHLQHKMHDIMAMFVFQASRRVLLFSLKQAFDKTLEELKENATERLQRRSDSLKAAIRHADEECRRLEYWSDVKKVVREGGTETATDKCEGWDESWRGVDNSGPPEPDTSR